MDTWMNVKNYQLCLLCNCYHKSMRTYSHVQTHKFELVFICSFAKQGLGIKV